VDDIREDDIREEESREDDISEDEDDQLQTRAEDILWWTKFTIQAKLVLDMAAEEYSLRQDDGSEARAMPRQPLPESVEGPSPVDVAGAPDEREPRWEAVNLRDPALRVRAVVETRRVLDMVLTAKRSRESRQLAQDQLAQNQLAQDQLAQDQLAEYQLAQYQLAQYQLAQNQLAQHQLAQNQLAQNQLGYGPNPLPLIAVPRQNGFAPPPTVMAVPPHQGLVLQLPVPSCSCWICNPHWVVFPHAVPIDDDLYYNCTCVTAELGWQVGLMFRCQDGDVDGNVAADGNVDPDSDVENATVWDTTEIE
jgi:hypothetical protein